MKRIVCLILSIIISIFCCACNTADNKTNSTPSIKNKDKNNEEYSGENKVDLFYESPKYNLIQPDTLTVATNATVKPFIYIENDKFAGFEYELIVKISKELGLKLIVQDMDFKYLLSSMEQCEADVAIGLVTATAERAKHVVFSIPYFIDEKTKDEYVVWVGKDTYLLNSINKAIEKLNSDGTIKELKEKYNISYVDWDSFS